MERWLRELTDKRIRRGTITGVAKLAAAIESFVQAHNQNSHASIWTAGVENIPAKVRRARAVLNNVAIA